MSEARWRRMVMGDIDAAVDIDAAWNSSPWQRTSFVKHLRHSHGLGAVAVLEERIAAFFIVTLEQEGCHLVNLAVAPGSRRRGLATTALHLVEDTARRYGEARIYLEVQVENRIAQELYLRRGFKVESVLRRYYQGADGLLMSKVLREDALRGL